MKEQRRGSITVFLALCLTLLSSFLLTSLEAARISAGRAYLSLLSSLGGQSFLASYYYPLFQEYGLLGVDAGYQSTYFSKEGITDQLAFDISAAAQGLQGGLLKLENPQVGLLSYCTLPQNAAEEFLAQVKQEAGYSGLELSLDFIKQEETMTVACANRLLPKQAAAQEAVANTSQELLELMTLIDGVGTGENGLLFDTGGGLKTEEFFVKAILPLSREETEGFFDNPVVFEAVAARMRQPEEQALQLQTLLGNAMGKETKRKQAEQQVAACKEKVEEAEAEKTAWSKQKKQLEREQKEKKKEQERVRKQLAAATPEERAELEKHAARLLQEQTELEMRIAEAERQQEAAEQQQRTFLTQALLFIKEEQQYRKERDAIVKEAKGYYTELNRELEKAEEKNREAQQVVLSLEAKQAVAWVAITAYEAAFGEERSGLPTALSETLDKEIEQLKLDTGMEQQGYDTARMKKTLEKNEVLLRTLRLSSFDSSKLLVMYQAVSELYHGIREYSADGLWFRYGEIHAGAKVGEGIKNKLEELLDTGVLALVGIEKKTLSDAVLLGEELPSEGTEKTVVRNRLVKQITLMQETIAEEGLFEVLAEGGQMLQEKLLLELYLMNHFSTYRNPGSGTRLAYEREYLLFGNRADRSNLKDMVLWVAAFRTVFTLPALLLDGERTALATALATSLVGFTGIPILISVVKYAILLLWAVEEALVETAAILAGKRIPLVCAKGRIPIGELFTMTPDRIKAKAQRLTSVSIGQGYEETLLLFSLLLPVRRQCYYAMDLIQENMRLRFRDSFRIRNVVTGVEFQVHAMLGKQFDTGLFPEAAYGLWAKQVLHY